MASKMDVYALCPCGSGKKVKFCCHAVLGEMDKVARLHETKQSQQALAVLEKLAEKYPEAPIVAITRAQLLMEERRFDEAALTMRAFLQNHPDSSHGIGLLAYARFMDVGFQEAKPEIHRAFQICPQSSPDVIGSLASQIADDVFYSSSMSAREHLGLALRLTRDQEERQALFQELMRVDGSAEIPFPLRGVHSLEELDVPEDCEKDVRTATRLSALGCWEIAAKLFDKLNKNMPDNWALWKNIGLCRAWDANNSGAAEALRKASELAPTHEIAVECETIAQLLELSDVEEQTPVKAARYKLSSTSMALSKLDDCDRTVRLPATKDQAGANPQVVGRYLLIDFPAPPDDEEVRDDNVPTVQAEVSVFDLNTQDGAVGILSVIGSDGDARNEAMLVIEDQLKDLIVNPEEDENHESDAPLYSESLVRSVLNELTQSQERKYYGTRLDLIQRREIAREEGRDFIENKWCNTRLNRLGCKTPLEAANDPELKVKRAAALHVLESISDVAMLYSDAAKLRKTLNIDEEAPFNVTEDTQLNSMSVLESHRLPISDLTDDQLGHIVHRALLIRHVPFAYKVLTEVAKRGVDRIQGIDASMFQWTIAQVCRELGHHDEALKWLKEGRDEVEKGDNFEEKFQWAMREFQFRIENRSDPALPELIDHLWNFYGKKLPGIRAALEPALKELGIPIPGETASGLVLPDGSEAHATAGAASNEGDSKLWLPGQ
ncbi:MAG: tetratricopeptide repeat protein [Rhodopirellula sp.]|nr:tetratricopeptide repeat protein [Rhodopirellula sp.]